MACAHYTVSGRVQGVFFRDSTRQQALSLGVQGWVRNLPDGQVELVACGTEQQLATLELWLKQGPPLAVVDNLSRTDWTGAEDFSGFEIRY